MSMKLEHDYIGSVNNTMENSESYKLCGNRICGLKTELSLGLPGSESPERRPNNLTIFGKDFEVGSSGIKGAKRVFSDAIDGGKKWVFTVNNDGCEGNLGNEKSGQKLDGGVKEGSVSVTSSCAYKKEEDVSAAAAPASKAQVVGWPPIRSYRKNTMASTSPKSDGNTEEKSLCGCLYVKVSMDGAPYLRKIDLQIYKNYMELSSALEKMFTCFINGQYRSHELGKQDENEGRSTEHRRTSEYVLTYEDKDGDWMLVGDVPWKMFTETCKKLRIMTGSEAIGLAPNAAEKCKFQA